MIPESFDKGRTFSLDSSIFSTVSVSSPQLNHQLFFQFRQENRGQRSPTERLFRPRTVRDDRGKYNPRCSLNNENNWAHFPALPNCDRLFWWRRREAERSPFSKIIISFPSSIG